MLWIVIMALLMLASAKPTHGPLGVEVKEAGKMKIGVDGSALHIVGKGECANNFIIWYSVSEVIEGYSVKREGFCPYIVPAGQEDFRFNTPCPLKLDVNGLIEVVVDKAPKGCSVTITNAYMPSKSDSEDDKDTSWVIYVAVLVPISVLLLLVVCVLIVWFCLRPRWKRARAARNAAAAQKAIGVEVEEEAAVAPALVSVPSNTAISSVPASTGMTPKATAVPPPVSSTAPSTVPPTTSTTPEAVKPSTPALPPTSSAAPMPPPVPTPAKPIPVNPPKPTLQTYSTPVLIDQRPVHNIKKPVVVPPTSSGSSGRRRRKKLELSTEDFVEPDKLTGAPKPRKEPRKKRKPTTPEPALPPPPPPPLTDEEPPPTLLSEREQRKRGRAEAVVDVLKASAKATADDCCPDDSKRASTEATKATPAKRPREKLVKFPLSDSRSQEKPEEVEKKARKATK